MHFDDIFSIFSKIPIKLHHSMGRLLLRQNGGGPGLRPRPGRGGGEEPRVVLQVVHGRVRRLLASGEGPRGNGRAGGAQREAAPER